MSIASRLWLGNSGATLIRCFDELKNREYTSIVYDSYGATFMQFKDGSGLIYDNGTVGMYRSDDDYENTER